MTRKGNGTPLVLIHGLASNAGFWRYNLADLRQRGFRVIALDLPGYGKSGKAYSTPYSMQFFAETVRALLQHLGIQKAVWVGHSMGGQISLTAALLFPEAIEKMVLLSPAGFEAFKEGEGNWLRNSVTPDFVKKTPPERIRANIVANFYNWDDKWEWMVEERTRLVSSDEFDRFAYAVWKSVGAMLDGYVWDRLHLISTPTLVIAGENDNLIPNPFLHGGRTREVMEQGTAAMKNAKLAMVPECGHMIQMEKSELVNQLIAEFARSTAAEK
ncbi:MAG: alpha/beta fold hydrolase [Chloroherpetonaceae bacterium]|nr:alpha/beta fold hydrolase [Chloroherpetonaceae bacterium]